MIDKNISIILWYSSKPTAVFAVDSGSETCFFPLLFGKCYCFKMTFIILIDRIILIWPTSRVIAKFIFPVWSEILAYTQHTRKSWILLSSSKHLRAWSYPSSFASQDFHHLQPPTANISGTVPSSQDSSGSKHVWLLNYLLRTLPIPPPPSPNNPLLEMRTRSCSVCKEQR